MSTVREPVADANRSLEERMAVESDAKESATTEDFPVPGWGSMCWVRMKVISHKIQREQVEKNRRHRRNMGTMELYVAADTIIAATDGFYEVTGEDDEGDTTLKPYDTDWKRLGIGVKKMGDETTPRQALIRLIGSERIVPFYGEYMDWLQGEREKANEEQKADFQPTPS